MSGDRIGTFRKILLITVTILTAITISATFVRYIVLNDYAIETKPMAEFTEDDF